MPTDITMPQLGESVTEGTVGRWLKQPGQRVEKYEPLLEVITDKVDSEVPSPAAGTLLEIVVAEGSTVRVGTVLARVGEAQEVAATPAATMAAVADQYDVEPGTLPLANGLALPTPLAAPAQRTRLTPVVARMVAEHQLDLGQISGTGANGRVSKQDVLRHLAQAEQRGTNGANGSPATPVPSIAPAIAAAPPAPPAPPVAPPAAPPAPESVATSPPSAGADTELVPLSAMRRAIATHMVHSMQSAPQVTNVFEIDLSRIVAHREQNRAAFERQGVRLTYTAYFFHATVAALQAVPLLNGRYTDQGIVMNRRINIGMAVALDQGLIVPVLHNADEKNLLGMARAVNDLAERARNRQLKPDETQGGTFTISNHGTGGSLFGTPVINQPQSAILGIGAMVKRAVVITQAGQDMIAIRPMSYCSLTFDHRLIDGSNADAFLSAFKQGLEDYR